MACRRAGEDIAGGTVLPGRPAVESGQVGPGVSGTRPADAQSVVRRPADGRAGLGPVAPPGRPATHSASSGVTLTLAEARLSGTSTGPETVQVALAGDDGSPWQLVGQVEVRTGPWSLYLVERSGRPSFPLAGRTLIVSRTNGAAVRSQAYRVPQLRLQFDRLAGDLRGRVAGAQVKTLELALASVAPLQDKWSQPTAGRVAQPASLSAWRGSARLEGDGQFRLRITQPGGLQGARAMTLTLETGAGLRMVIHRQTPWVQGWLPGGEVAGGGAPLAPVQVSLRGRSGELRGRALGRADERGLFHVRLHDAAGEWLAPRPGDRLLVEAGDLPWSVGVPQLVVRAEPGSGVVRGLGPPGTQVQLVAWSWREPTPAGTQAEAGASGAWSAALPWAAEPGTAYCAATKTDPGDSWHSCGRLPLLTLEPGSSRLTLEAGPGISGSLSLLRAGQEMARASVRQEWDDSVRTNWLAGDGTAVAAASGDQVRGRVNGVAVDFRLPLFGSDLHERSIVGRVEGGTSVLIAVGREVVDQLTAADSGHFRWPVGASAARPLVELDKACLRPAVTAFVLTGDGHRVGRRFGCASLSVDLDRAVVRGQAEPGLVLSWSGPLSSEAGCGDLGSHPSPAGRTPALAGAVTGGLLVERTLTPAEGASGAPPAIEGLCARVPISGSFQLRLPPPLAPGARRILWVGQERLEIVVPPLSVNLDTTTGVAKGRGPAGEVVELRVYLGRRSPPASVSVPLDDSGGWQVNLRGEVGDSHTFDPAAIRRLEIRCQDGAGIEYRRSWRPREPTQLG